MRRRTTKRDAPPLAATPHGFRAVEVAAIVAFVLLWPWLLVSLLPTFRDAPEVVPLALLVGYLGADLLSGFFHWLFDTWWRPDTPVIGRVFVRTFREHHVDPQAITRHDFIETNGSNMLAGAALLAGGFALLGSDRGAELSASCLLSVAWFLGWTSQIHKWAHMEEPPALVRALQRSRILLSREAHALHHEAPFTRSYCITSGWFNRTLQYLRFFRVLEAVIMTITGAHPRSDDGAPESLKGPRTRPR